MSRLLSGLSPERFNITVVGLAARGGDIIDQLPDHINVLDVDSFRQKLFGLLSALDTAVLTDSEAASTEAIQSGVPPEKVHQLPIAGINPGNFMLTSHEPKEQVIVGTVGQLDPVKNTSVILELAEIVEDTPIEFRIAGDGSERDNLEQRVREIQNVTLNGFIAPENVPEFLSELDVYFQASLREGLCITVIEAMAAGLPVVASNVGGITEAVIEGKMGMLEEPTAPSAFAQDILELSGDPERRSALGTTGRERVERYYSQEILVEEFKSTIKDVYSPDHSQNNKILGDSTQVIMYSFQSIKNAVEQPRLAIGEINRIIRQGLAFRSVPANPDDGVDIISKDWDRLILLDACRFDLFKELASDIPGKIEKVESKASATTQFLRANFSNRELHDTVYVTANPQLYRIKNGTDGAAPINVQFHDQIQVWKESWHNEHGTVMPEKVTEAALDATKKYPNKRIIIHYLQPHAPYIGPTGINKSPTEYTNLWGAYRKGKMDISLETAKQAYRENLELVLTHVLKLLTKLEAKTVVTADHGELLGERDSPIPIRRFGHPAHTALSGLIDIPWLVHEQGTRPQIIPENPTDNMENESFDSSVIKDRLRDLGYA